MTEVTMELEKQEVETPAGVERTRARRTFVPRVDIYEVEDQVIMLIDMPGITEDSVDITLEKNLLTIRGYAEDVVHDGYERLYREYIVGDYERTFSLSDEVNRDEIKASLSNGVLRIELPKAEEAKARKIQLNAS